MQDLAQPSYQLMWRSSIRNFLSLFSSFFKFSALPVVLHDTKIGQPTASRACDDICISYLFYTHGVLIFSRKEDITLLSRN